MPTVAKSPPHAVAALANAISQPNGVQAVGGVVTDQAGRWLRYERLMNQAEYQAIVGSKWYQLSVLNGLPSITLPTNSLELKSSWKILTPAEIASGRYYTTSAIVYNTPDHAPSPGANPVTLGLVGLHIIQKTKSQPGFFWSTFEQVDNDKVFFNPHSTAPVNKQTAQKPYTELMQNGTPINQPVQIKRHGEHRTVVHINQVAAWQVPRVHACMLDHNLLAVILRRNDRYTSSVPVSVLSVERETAE